MMLNLSKSFQFQKDQQKYAVDYRFKKATAKDGSPAGISLELKISVNDEGQKMLTVNKATSTLYQSNELIEKMIEEEAVSFINQ